MEEKDTFRKLVYICAPDPKLDTAMNDGYQFDSDYIIHNRHLINQFAAFAYHNDRIPLSVFDESQSGVQFGTRLKDKMVVMGKCEEIWVLSENGVTPSMAVVIDRAKLRHKKVLYFKVAKDPDQIFEEVGGIE